MQNVKLVLLIFAFVLFAVAAIFPDASAPPPGKLRFVAAGLACWVASAIF